MFTDTLTKTVTDAQEQTLGAITSLQDKVLEWNRDAASTMTTWVGSSPIASPALPFAEKLLDPAGLYPALVDRAFTFTADLLAANRRFTAALLETWTPRPNAD